MSFKLSPIDQVDRHISAQEFEKNYLKPKRPVVIKQYAKRFPAFEKWTPEYLKQTIGDQVVPLFNSSKADPSKPINTPTTSMRFPDYLDLMLSEPTELRMFAFDILSKAPALLKDYSVPKDLAGGFLDKFPNMFFGGKGSITFLHYDIDLAHIYQMHFHGRKRIILFEQKWSERLYKLPLATYALEDYSIENPDYIKFPSLRGVEGLETILEHGDMLFMPTTYWHWMKYLDGGYSLSLRAWEKSIPTNLHSLYNLFIQRNIDNVLKTTFKGKYLEFKEKIAVKRANEALLKGLPH